jgi:hypothetical protein
MKMNMTRAVSIFLSSLVVLFCVFFLLILLPDSTSAVAVRIKKITGVPDTVQHFQNASIVGPGQIIIPHPTTTMRCLAPRDELDPFYLILITLAAIVWIVFFNDFSYTNPFTRKAHIGVRVGFWLLALFVFLNFWRQSWFDQIIRELTRQEYAYDRPTIIFSPEYLVAFILLRMMWIYKRGMALQKETDLTV